MHSGGRPSEIVRIIKMLTYKNIPYNRKDPIYKYSDIDFSGTSFLLNPELLFYNAYKHDVKDIALYLSLASVRQYPEYIINGDLTLPLIKSPVENPQEFFIDPDSLLFVKDQRIHLIYEEAINETIH